MMSVHPLKHETIKGLHFTYVNQYEFRTTCLEVFKWHAFDFRTRTKAPLIIDCGAHIGVSLLHFKQKYPESRVIGFEANPNTFELLEKNVQQNQLSGVELIQVAVSDQEGLIPFYIGKEVSSGELTQWGDAGVRNTWNTEDVYTTMMVPAVHLSSYIGEPVDFLKINIEGMEGIVLKDIEPKLHLVKELRIWFHGSSTNPANTLEDILALLSRNGFRYVLEQRSLVVGLAQVKRTDPYHLTIYTYTQRFPWLVHRYLWYVSSRMRKAPALVRWISSQLQKPRGQKQR